jgi:hypothetical protein
MVRLTAKGRRDAGFGAGVDYTRITDDAQARAIDSGDFRITDQAK